MIPRRALLALALLPALAGCLATQQNVRDLQAQLDQIRSQQEQMLREFREQNDRMLDSLSRQGTRTRGDLANRILQMERQLVQIQELTGQSQQAVSQLRQQLRERERQQEQARAQADTTGGGESAPPTPDASEAEEVYNEALAAFRRGSHATAREGFEEFLRAAPRHRLAADAQFHVGETYAQTRNPQQAIDAWDRVVEQFPASPRAAAALFRAGQVELGRNRRDEARARFNQVVRAYPRSPEATRARQELTRLGTR